jgi:D-sedoheptulose 7-phosphate isomerase
MDTTTFKDYFDTVEEAVGKIPLSSVAQAAKLIKNARNFSQRVWIVGNGGSAATAMHFSNDLQKMLGIDALAIPSLIPTILAYGNDDGWDQMFSFAMKSFEIGDILIAISCSGSSMNVINAARFALKRDGKLIILTGPVWVENELGNMPGVVISVESKDIKVVEDVHLVICHAIAGVLANEVRSPQA